MPNKQEKMTAFGQFRILKIGTKYIQAELIGSVKNGGVSKSMLKKSRLDFDKIEKCE